MNNNGNGQGKLKFLKAHEGGATVAEAARCAGIHRSTVYRWREQDPEFAMAWDEARQKLVEDLEMEAYKRAIDGSDRMLIFLLKAYKPDTYNEKTQQGRSSAIGLTLAELAEKVRQWL